MPAEKVRFVIKAMPADENVPQALPGTMQPHPLVHQELAHDPEFGLYNHRLISLSMKDVTPDEMYWKVRCEAGLRHTGERALEIRGVDAPRLLNRVFTREVGKTKVGRCSYQFACFDDGGMITDGVLVRLAEDRFWFGQAEGDLLSWIKALALGLDVAVGDPGGWISQVQGPNALKILEAAVDGAYPEPFRYFDAAEVTIAGQPVVITRTGFTNELGWEFYLDPATDREAIGERILEAGRPFGLVPIAAFGARRIEAGLLNAGSDFDHATTPFAAGLGNLVDFDKGDFVGRRALTGADRSQRVWGLQVEAGVAAVGGTLERDGAPAGLVSSSAWSPYQRCGVALVRMETAEHQEGGHLDVACTDGATRPGTLCETPMYDKDRLIPRGKVVDIPVREPSP
ncbi:MAG: aminomethyltransferase family protein [Geminicoccaceae bacterium]